MPAAPNGSLVALITPMLDDGSVDFDALGALVDWHVESGTDGIVAVGTTGESATLDETEHCAVIRAVVEQAAGRVPVIAGTGANATREAIALTRCARDAGADACLLVTPYYNKPTQRGLYEHYRAVAEAVDIPQILYNVTGRTACTLAVETTARLAELGNIVGIKEADNLDRVGQLHAACPEGFKIWSGNDDEAREAIYAGAVGVISVTANVAPRQMQQMCAAALAGDRSTADAVDTRLANLHGALFVEPNPIPVKWAVHRLGRCGAGIRLPMTWLSDEFHSQVESALEDAGVI